MTKAEIAAYNWGRTLAQAAVAAMQEGRGALGSKEYILTPEAQAALDKLGLDRWWDQVQKGGNAVLGEQDAVRPLPT